MCVGLRASVQKATEKPQPSRHIPSSPARPTLAVETVNADEFLAPLLVRWGV